MKAFQNRLNTAKLNSWIIIYQGFVVWWNNYVVAVMVTNFSLLESSLCQNVRILDKRFPASIIVPFKFKCNPSKCKWDPEMLLWKMTFLSSCFKMLLYFLSMLFASFLSVRTTGDDMTMFLQFGWNLIMVSLTFTNSLYIVNRMYIVCMYVWVCMYVMYTVYCKSSVFPPGK